MLVLAKTPVLVVDGERLVSVAEGWAQELLDDQAREGDEPAQERAKVGPSQISST
jgi:hypothetical protein